MTDGYNHQQRRQAVLPANATSAKGVGTIFGAAEDGSNQDNHRQGNGRCRHRMNGNLQNERGYVRGRRRNFTVVGAGNATVGNAFAFTVTGGRTGKKMRRQGIR